MPKPISLAFKIWKELKILPSKGDLQQKNLGILFLHEAFFLFGSILLDSSQTKQVKSVKIKQRE